MLKIRTEQIKVFQPVAETAFLNRLVEYLQKQHPQVAVQLGESLVVICQIPTEQLKTLVEQGIKRARAYSMTDESSIAAFVVLMFVTAPNFDEHPLIQRLLNDEKILPNERIDGLWQRTTEQNWQVVKQNYNPNAWKAMGENK
jgi:hypothetical protein